MYAYINIRRRLNKMIRIEFGQKLILLHQTDAEERGR